MMGANAAEAAAVMAHFAGALAAAAPEGAVEVDPREGPPLPQ